MAKPVKFAHVVYSTRRFDEMIAWYQNVFEAKVVYQNPVFAFLTYDGCRDASRCHRRSSKKKLKHIGGSMVRGRPCSANCFRRLKVQSVERELVSYLTHR